MSKQRVLRRLMQGVVIAAITVPLPMIWYSPVEVASAAGPPAPAAASPAGGVADVSASGSTFEATLVDARKKAAMHTATVRVEVEGVKLVDPDTTDGKPSAGEGHLHYRLDAGPVIATTAPKLSFHEIEPGHHLIEIVLVGNDHKPIARQQKIDITMPEG